ncbi:olfactory receptor 6-like [Microcaecilia unicolor]|uniref:Olfactory receptor n=1 Tax=Microcaecilia unicolor TaxID=1415580 RepID=A0A6P7WN62_9AMPH|nr:olfactory receptor 6-like [Microcaecilia unicolor]
MIDLKNATIIQEFILVGFHGTLGLQVFLFFIFSFAYLLTLVGNLTIIVIVRLNSQLHKPMYFFLSNLSFLEIWYTMVIVPRMLANFLMEDKTISFIACMTQLYFFLSLVCTECVLLAVMAVDRYVAICIPLRYTIIMNNQLCVKVAVVSWMSGFIISMIKVYYISGITMCGTNIINHFFCDVSPLLNLACTDKGEAETVDFIFAMLLTAIPLSVILISYICIIVTVLSIPSTSGRKKAFSTCASHLTVVIIFYSTTLFMYARPKAIYSFDSNKVVSLIYTVITPFLNPFIYCFRNKEVKDALRKTMRKRDQM